MKGHFFATVFLVAFTSLLIRLWISNASISAKKVGLAA